MRAVFLDKDGTLLPDIPYNADPTRMTLAPGAAEGLRALAAGFALVVVSNQSGVALGCFPESALGGVHGRLCELVHEAGAELAGFYYCPHRPDGIVPGYAFACACRKPAPGLLERAANELGIDLAASWMVGDILNDVEAGRRAGCRTVLIENGNETEWRFGPLRVPNFRAFDLTGAARCILEAEGMPSPQPSPVATGEGASRSLIACAPMRSAGSPRPRRGAENPYPAARVRTAFSKPGAAP